MWLPFSKRRRSHRTQANHSKTSRPTYRPRLEALEDRQLLSPAPLYSYSMPSSQGWAVAVDNSGDAYIAGQGNMVGKLDPTGTSFQSLNYLSGGGGTGTAIALDSAGNIYVTGQPGPNFALTSNAFSNTPSYQFVSELDPTGSNLLYSTYIPGSQLGPWSDRAEGIAVDGAGNIYVTGAATSGFITTPNAFQPAGTGTNAYIAEFNPALSGSASLIYGSFLGAGQSSGDGGTAVAVDGSGNVYITGVTFSSAFPTTAGAFQTVFGGASDSFVAKFNTSLSGAASLVYSTFLGGTGNDGFCLAYGHPFTGGGWPYFPGPAIAVDSSGAAYVSGATSSANFPTTPGAFQTAYYGGGSNSGPFGSDAYVTKLNASGSALVYSSLLGGTGIDNAYSIALDPYGNATVSGATASTDFPLKNPIQSTFQGGQPSPYSSDVFVTTFNASGSALLFSTYLGGAGLNLGCGVALDSAGSVYVTGFTVSPASGFVYKISAPVGPSFTVSGFPTTITAGTSGTITVTALNADGSVNTGYSGAVHFSSSDRQAVLPPDATLTNGTGTFSVTLKTAGTQWITASDTGNSNIAGSESGITVTPGAATHFLISGPTSIAANTFFSITLTAVDAYGNIATGYRGTVHFSDSVGGANLPGNYTFQASDKGVHTFTNLKLKTKGMQTITIWDTLNNTILGAFLINVT